MKLETDGKTATLEIQGVFTPTQIETLITHLGELRAHMDPPVSYQLPSPATEDLEVSEQSNPYVAVRLLRDGRIRFWLRNHGLGWMMFNLEIDKAIAIRDYLNANTPDQEARPTLFSEGIGDPGTAH